ncbi:MAG TPA: hypothetical protein VIF35_19675, partial [Streptosporangiaceae bacterium]
PVSVPWGMMAGDWMIGGVSFSETLATALGIPHVVGVAEGISRARYYPGVEKVRVKLLAEPGTLRLIGAQMVGREGIKERADFLAMEGPPHPVGRRAAPGLRAWGGDFGSVRADLCGWFVPFAGFTWLIRVWRSIGSCCLIRAHAAGRRWMR